MANWKENKYVGIGAALITVICLIVIVKVIISQQANKAKLTPEMLRMQEQIDREMGGGN